MVDQILLTFMAQVFVPMAALAGGGIFALAVLLSLYISFRNLF